MPGQTVHSSVILASTATDTFSIPHLVAAVTVAIRFAEEESEEEVDHQWLMCEKRASNSGGGFTSVCHISPWCRNEFAEGDTIRLCWEDQSWEGFVTDSDDNVAIVAFDFDEALEDGRYTVQLLPNMQALLESCDILQTHSSPARLLATIHSIGVMSAPTNNDISSSCIKSPCACPLLRHKPCL